MFSNSTFTKIMNMLNSIIISQNKLHPFLTDHSQEFYVRTIWLICSVFVSVSNDQIQIVLSLKTYVLSWSSSFTFLNIQLNYVNSCACFCWCNFGWFFVLVRVKIMNFVASREDTRLLKTTALKSSYMQEKIMISGSDSTAASVQPDSCSFD